MIRGKIDRKGVLFIERAGVLVEQICPLGEMKNCGHHCPLFGEPFRKSHGKIGMSLCGKILIIFDGFIDERVSDEEDNNNHLEIL